MFDHHRRGRVGVLLGGLSAERPISLNTGGAILRALLERGHDAVAIDVGRDLHRRLAEEGVEVAFNALHGTFGEDGCVQGLLEVLGIPYTGCGVAASALTMDKIQTKRVLEHAGVPTPEWVLLEGATLAPGSVPLAPPLVVKPVSEGSSVGISMVARAEELPAALSEAARHGGRVLVERRISGPEVTVGVLDGRALATVEIRPRDGWYDWHHKYTPGATDYICPADLGASVREELHSMAERAAAVTGCEGAVRVDFMVEGGTRPLVIEINTVPGMTETSLLPKAAARAGLSFGDLCERILAGARLRSPEAAEGAG